MLVLPCVRIPIIIQVVLVHRAVLRVCTTLCYNLNLGTRRAVEVCSLICGVDLKFFQTIRRRGDNARRTGSYASTLISNSASRITGESGGVDAHAAIHVVGILAAVKLETALIDDCSGNTSIRANTGLECHEGADVAPKARQRLQRDSG